MTKKAVIPHEVAEAVETARELGWDDQTIMRRVYNPESYRSYRFKTLLSALDPFKLADALRYGCTPSPL